MTNLNQTVINFVSKETKQKFSKSSHIQMILDTPLRKFINLHPSVHTVKDNGKYSSEYRMHYNMVLTDLYNLNLVELGDVDRGGVKNIVKINLDMSVEEIAIIVRTRHNLSNVIDVDNRNVLSMELFNVVNDDSSLANKTLMESYVAIRYLQKQINSINRGIEFKLTIAQYKKLINRKTCYYSGLPFDENTKGMALSLDRKDNSIGYTNDNTVACLSVVNNMKANLVEDYSIMQNLDKQHIKKVLLAFSNEIIVK